MRGQVVGLRQWRGKGGRKGVAVKGKTQSKEGAVLCQLVPFATVLFICAGLCVPKSVLGELDTGEVVDCKL